MLASNLCACGTTTTGTGTLTLAALPTGAGRYIDPFHAFGGLGLGTSQPTPCNFTIVEYDGSGFTPANIVQIEDVVGTFTLGASLTACTMQRLIFRQTITGMNSTPVSTISAAFGMTIVNAANVVVFFGASPFDVPATAPLPYQPGSPPFAIYPLHVGQSITGVSQTAAMTGYAIPVMFSAGFIAQRCGLSVTSPVAITASTLIGALYAAGQGGATSPGGKLLCAFGALGGTNPLGTGGLVMSAQTFPGAFIRPFTPYWFAYWASFTGTSVSMIGAAGGAFFSGLESAGSGGSPTVQIQISGSGILAPDPMPSIVVTRTNQNVPLPVFFAS